MTNTIEDLLDSTQSKKGDVFFVDAGTIHAIGKGNVIAEIQQNSNVTYRLYDYDRRDKEGNPRELHIEKGVAASNANKISKREIPLCSDGSRLLGSCEYFSVKEYICKMQLLNKFFCKLISGIINYHIYALKMVCSFNNIINIYRFAFRTNSVSFKNISCLVMG